LMVCQTGTQALWSQRFQQATLVSLWHTSKTALMGLPSPAPPYSHPAFPTPAPELRITNTPSTSAHTNNPQVSSKPGPKAAASPNWMPAARLEPVFRQLHPHIMILLHQHRDTGGRQPDAVFMILNFFGDTDTHKHLRSGWR